VSIAAGSSMTIGVVQLGQEKVLLMMSSTR
jgi:hypothetical protein